LKFAARLGLAHWFADQLALRAQAASKFDLMIPVPLSARRLALRGYNQSWQIAKPLARHLQVPASWSRLRRLRDTAPQTTLSSAQARCDNVRGAFAVDAGCVRHAHIAVVDDVMTSGATLAEIARTLKRAGAASVTNLVALRTPAP
jgi:ComF family protein